MATTAKKLPMDKQKFVDGGIPMQYIYTVGPSLEPFFLKMKETEKFQAAKCESCGTVYVPSSMFCESCFKQISGTVMLNPEGVLLSFTVAHIGPHGEELQKPEILGLILINGADTPFIHRIIGEPGDTHIGCAVKARFKPKGKRSGSWDDIEGFVIA